MFTLWVAFVHLHCSPNHLICDDIIVVFVSGAPILCDDIIVRQWVNKLLFIIVIVLTVIICDDTYYCEAVDREMTSSNLIFWES